MSRTSKSAQGTENEKAKMENGKAGGEAAADAASGELEAESVKAGDEVAVEADSGGSEPNPRSGGAPRSDGVVSPNPEFEKELAAERERYLRLAAEYDNFRKRSAKEREMIYGDARIDTISRLLPVYDNLERALKMECADEAFYKGIELTMTQLTEILENMDVTRIPAVGEKFDPNHHNAVMTIENPELEEKTVAEEFQKGFILGERVIRFSTVVVAN